MRYIFKFPDIGEGISEGKILKWYVSKGQSIKSGEAVVKMETDKVVTDIPSPRDGMVATLYGREGEVIKVEDPLLEIEIEGVAGEDAQKLAREKPARPREEPIDEKGFGVVGTLDVAGDAAFLPSSGEGMPETAPDTVARKALATPVARAMARDLGVDINRVPGSGPGGRVMKEDIRRFAEIGTAVGVPGGGPVEAAAPVEYQPLSQIRKTIARNMVRSKQSAAHMTLFETVEISRLISLRSAHKERFQREGVRLTYLSFIFKATALALRSHPVMNSEMDLEHGRLVLKRSIHLGLAVDTEEGLVVPVIRDVDRISIRAIAEKIVELAEKARERTLSLPDLKDATFTVTNYGSIAGIFGSPVINYPQAAILGVGRIMKAPVVESDSVKVGHLLPLSLAVDHRIVDGGEAARFMLRLMEYLQDPAAMLLI